MQLGETIREFEQDLPEEFPQTAPVEEETPEAIPEEQEEPVTVPDE